MFRIAVKSALSKKLRLFSTALSVILGVAFLALGLYAAWVFFLAPSGKK